MRSAERSDARLPAGDGEVTGTARRLPGRPRVSAAGPRSGGWYSLRLNAGLPGRRPAVTTPTSSRLSSQALQAARAAPSARPHRFAAFSRLGLLRAACHAGHARDRPAPEAGEPLLVFALHLLHRRRIEHVPRLGIAPDMAPVIWLASCSCCARMKATDCSNSPVIISLTPSTGAGGSCPSSGRPTASRPSPGLPAP